MLDQKTENVREVKTLEQSDAHIELLNPAVPEVPQDFPLEVPGLPSIADAPGEPVPHFPPGPEITEQDFPKELPDVTKRPSHDLEITANLSRVSFSFNNSNDDWQRQMEEQRRLEEQRREEQRRAEQAAAWERQQREQAERDQALRDQQIQQQQNINDPNTGWT